MYTYTDTVETYRFCNNKLIPKCKCDFSPKTFILCHMNSICSYFLILMFSYVFLKERNKEGYFHTLHFVFFSVTVVPMKYEAY